MRRDMKYGRRRRLGRIDKPRTNDGQDAAARLRLIVLDSRGNTPNAGFLPGDQRNSQENIVCLTKPLSLHFHNPGSSIYSKLLYIVSDACNETI